MTVFAPLVAVAVSLFPDLVRLLAGKDAGDLAEKVTKQVSSTLKTENVDEIKAELDKNPTARAELQKRLAEIAFEETKAQIEAENQRRKDELSKIASEREFQFKTLQEKLNQFEKIRDDENKRDDKEFGDIRDARKTNLDIISSGSKYSWINPVLSIVIVAGFFGFSLLLLLPGVQIDQSKDVFYIALGALAAAFSTVVGFHFGSSIGSKQKDSMRQVEAMFNDVNGQRNQSSYSHGYQEGENSQKKTSEDGVVESGNSPPASRNPGSLSLFLEELPRLSVAHKHFEDGVSWKLSTSGIEIDGAPAERTPGSPQTVSSIWQKYGSLCSSAAKEYSVPVELIVATIATESRGDPSATRFEPKRNDKSVGLMQTLVGTAREALGRPSLSGDDLLDPGTSIRAGTAYIARQRTSTRFDPPLVAAAYNAGSIVRNSGEANRWKLKCWPIDTGEHIDRFVSWFGDAMSVSHLENWAANSTPSFASTLFSQDKFKYTHTGNASPQNLKPLSTLAERQEIFGKFAYEPDPTADNPERIRILNTWSSDNIVEVSLKGIKLPGSRADLTILFHRRGATQLFGVWMAWKEAGLIDRILTFDGGYNPRFIRGSNSALSNHAFGSAFDINAAWNPLGKRPAQYGEKGSVVELVEIANRWGFYWGGNFQTRPDGMHFEIAQVKN